MRFPSPVSVQWLAEFTGSQLRGLSDASATGINELHKVEPGDIAFVDHPKYYQACLQSRATVIIINQEVEAPTGKTLLVNDNPFEAYTAIVRHFRPFKPATRLISEDLQVGEGTYIAPGVFIGEQVQIGRDCRIMPNVTILGNCVIGDRVVIQSGSVIGSDAFYYNSKKNRDVWYKRMESCGRVVIEDDVEIGAGCTIDRGVSHDTVIGAGTKMDNQIHIGHDTLLGRNCLIAAQVGIAGAVTIEDGVVIWGQAGISKTLTIGANAVILAQAGVPSSLEGGKVYWGTPAIDAQQKRKELVWVKRIPEIWEKLMKG